MKMRYSKEATENNGILMIHMKPLDENYNLTTNNKKSSVIDYSQPESSADLVNDIRPVSFIKLFCFSSSSEKCLLILALAAAISGGAVTVGNMLLFANMTDSMINFASQVTNNSSVIGSDEFLDTLQRFAIGNSIIGGLVLILGYTSNFLFNYTAQKQIHRIRSKFLMSALHQDIAWYDLNQTGDFASRLTEDLNKLEDGFGEKVGIFANFLSSTLASIIMAFVEGWELTLICLIVLPVTLITMGILNRLTSSLSKMELEAYGKASSIAEEVLSSIRTVVAFSGQDKEVNGYKSNLVLANKINIKRGFYIALTSGVNWFFIYSSLGLSFWYGIGLVLDDMDKPESNQVYTAGTMVMIFFLVMQGSGNLGAAAPYIETFGVAKGAAAKVFSLIDRVPLINNLSEEGVCPSGVKGIITFKDVHFEYPSRCGVKVLKGFNLTINEGEKVAFVGSSGCGKSTCVQMIQRFYDPQQGQILLDGMDIKYLNVAWLRRQIGVVGQEPVLFQTSIAENIKMGHENATRRDIIEAAGVANVRDFIGTLPEGYDTLVGERGAQLSGGQKQGIAIARALVRKPHILLLDEATSALDTSSEAKVQAALDKASEGRTTIIVAHRLSTVRGADRIVTINDGKVAEQGTHEELIALKGHYYKLVMAQVNSGEESWAMDISKNTEDKERSIEDEFVIPDFLQEDKIEFSSPEENVAKELPKSSLLQVMRLNKPEWPYIFIACVCSIIMGAAMPVLAVLFGSLIQVLGLPNWAEIHNETNKYSIYFVTAGFGIGLSTVLQVYTITLTGEKLTLRLRRMLFAAMLRQEIAWFDEKANSSGALCARLSGDASQVQGATGQRLSIIIQSIATFLLAVGLAMYYEWRLGLVGLAFSPVIMAAQYYFIVVQSGELLNKREAMEQAIQIAVEAVRNIRTVAGLGREHTFHQKYMKELETVHLVALRNCHFRALVFGMASSIMFFAYSACMYYGGKLVEQEGIPYSNIFKVSQALILGTASVGSALAFAPNLQKGLVAARKVFQLLNRHSNIVDPEPLGRDKWVAEGSTDYSKVVFSYPTRRHVHVLQDFSMSVRPGQTIALVGPSGCGKTTCVQLLERFYDPSSGVVMLDGRDISSVPLYSLRSQLGVVSQEPVLFNRTIADNIAYGDNMRNVPMSEIVKAAEQANIHTFIASLPMGYQTYIGEKGVQLSGGQKQRVSIARALIRNPRVLILDEATSALDTECEKVVQKALERAKEGRTCITIAHRLSTVQDADIICVLNDGKVIEQGSHSQLLEQKGVYHKLYSLQLGQS